MMRRFIKRFYFAINLFYEYKKKTPSTNDLQRVHIVF